MSEVKNPYPQQPYDDDEISLKDLILKFREFRKEIWRSKLLVFSIMMLFAAGFLAKAFIDKTEYTSGLRFLLSGTTPRSTSVGDFDFVPVENNKITELAKSGRIIHNVLLNKANMGGKDDYIANHIINLYEFHEEWNKEPYLEEYAHLHLGDFYFKHDAIGAFQQREYRALNILHEFLTGSSLRKRKGIMNITYDLKSEIFTLNVKSLDDNLSTALANAIYNELRAFYVEQTVGRPTKALGLVTVEVDSLYNQLTRAEAQYAGLSDRDRGLVSVISKLPREKLARDISLFEQEYKAALSRKRSLEQLLARDTPEFQIIDQTFIPIVEKLSKPKMILIGLFLGGFLAFLYVIGRKIVREALAE